MAVVTVSFNGSPYGGWKEVEITNQFDQAVGEATVQMSMTPYSENFPCQLGDVATITIDGRPVVTGHVHTVSGSDDFGSHNVRINIRDKTQDLVDSTIGPKQEVKPPASLKRVCEDTLKKMKLNIGVVDKVSPQNFNPAEMIKGWIDDRGHNYLDRYARARQCLLTTDGKGNLVIDRNQKRLGAQALFRGREDNPANNIEKSSFEVSDAGRHNEHSAAGQKSPNDRKHWESKSKGEASAQSNPVSKNLGRGVDTSVRPERKQHYRGGIGVEGKTPEDAAKWRASVARGRGVDYTATVSGFYCNGQLWWPGYIIPVSDSHWNLSTEMLIKSVTLRKSFDGGETTEVKLTEKNAFSNEPEAKKETGRTGKGGIGNTPPGTYPDGGV